MTKSCSIDLPCSTPAMQLKRKIVNELLCAEFIVKVKYIGMRLFATNEVPPMGNRSISDQTGWFFCHAYITVFPSAVLLFESVLDLGAWEINKSFFSHYVNKEAEYCNINLSMKKRNRISILSSKRYLWHWNLQWLEMIRTYNL